jgi:biotin synthase|uniref:Biotin synthase n=1 Tax=uncultured marine thaumarchaeote KM3_69_B11 TaxID=1456244 RepID=A0A075HKR4_9ARCH|nr:biotin synthase (bioB) [uncultured marine thaumarchaeote KM3_69_B11]|tara:strand:+ start:4651 stop:5631 length:981 start_codon:yes stop_codon:yes gene_type:complete
MNSTEEVIQNCKNSVLNNKQISKADAKTLFQIKDNFLKNLSDAANEITRFYQGKKIDIEQLTNIKKNYCSEDCSFCSQSAFFNTKIDDYKLQPADEIVDQAKTAKNNGADSFCLVAAWREPSDDDFHTVCNIIKEINSKVGISLECSLGFLTIEQAKKLKLLNVKRYNHNLETSRTKFPEICTTHTFDDRINTLKIARQAGLELCTGGIIGIGETKKQREEFILEVAELNPEEVTINLLVPFPGTPLEFQKQLELEEILRVFAVLRFLLPRSIIKISGGREVNLNDDGKELLLSGANGIISAGYLTLGGNSMNKDSKMIKEMDLET